MHLLMSWQEEGPPTAVPDWCRAVRPGSGRSRKDTRFWVSVCGGSCTHRIFRDFGAGWVDARKVLDVTVPVHLQGHDGLFHSLLMAAGRGQEIFWK